MIGRCTAILILLLSVGCQSPGSYKVITPAQTAVAAVLDSTRAVTVIHPLSTITALRDTVVYSFYDDEKTARAEYDRLVALDKTVETTRTMLSTWGINKVWVFCPTIRRFHWIDILYIDVVGLPSPREKAQELLNELRSGPNGAYWRRGMKQPKGLSDFIKRLNEFNLLQV